MLISWSFPIEVKGGWRRGGNGDEKAGETDRKEG